MGKHPAKEADFYDEMYKSGGSGGNYVTSYNNTAYSHIWKRITELLRAMGNPRILEIGCGPGQLAHMLWDNGLRNYFGFDFSEVAIKMARKNSPQKFAVADARDPDIITDDYDVYLITEVLEHIDDDLGLLKRIPAGKVVIFSVPTFGCVSHVRYFPKWIKAAQRYRHLIRVETVDRFRKRQNPAGVRWYLCKGVKKYADSSEPAGDPQPQT